MSLTVDDVVTHYLFSSHPRNRAIVDIKNKKTGDIKFIKIRHRLENFYAVSLVDPISFEVYAETQTKTTGAKIKPIVIHGTPEDIQVELRGSSRIGFEWSFDWEGEKYKWVKESKMSGVLECRAVRKTGDVCIAQYLPRVLKDEYFGIFSILGYNMLRCNLTQTRELELLLFMSLLVLLDKSDNNSWKRDPISKGIKEETPLNDTASSVSTPSGVPFDYPVPEKALRKKMKAERNNEQKLKVMIEKGVRKSQKQLQTDLNTNQPRRKSVEISTKSDISSSSSIDTSNDDQKAVGTLTQLFLELGNLRHEEYPITPPTLSLSSATSSRSRSSSDSQTSVRPITNNHSTSAFQKNPSNQPKCPSYDTNIYSHQGRLAFRDNQRGNQRYVYNQQNYPSGELHNFSSLSLSSSSRRPRLLPDQRRSSASDYIGNSSYQYNHDFDPHGIYSRLSLSEFHNGNRY